MMMSQLRLLSLTALLGLALPQVAAAQPTPAADGSFVLGSGYSAYGGLSSREYPGLKPIESGLAVGGHAEWGGRSEWVGFGLVGELGLAGYSKGSFEVPVMFGVRLYIWNIFIGLNSGFSLYERQPHRVLGKKGQWAKHARGALPIGYSADRWELYLQSYAMLNTDAEKRRPGAEDAFVRGLGLHFAWKF